jgi:hypothetical protein
MCLIAYAAQDRGQIPDVHLARAHARNDDAWGIMYPQAGHVQLVRDITDHPAFLSVWRSTPRHTPIAAHFRYGTSGSMAIAMAHPFPVLMDKDGVTLAVMHNGVMSCVTDEGALSDTAVFVRDVLKPQLEARPDLIEVEGWRNAMGAILGDENKLLFMRADGAVFLVNGWQGEVEDGVWYSNTYSIAPPRLPRQQLDQLPGFGQAGWAANGDNTCQVSHGAFPHPYVDPLDDLDGCLGPYPQLSEMSEAEIYNFVCSHPAEDVTDAILEMFCGH